MAYAALAIDRPENPGAGYGMEIVDPDWEGCCEDAQNALEVAAEAMVKASKAFGEALDEARECRMVLTGQDRDVLISMRPEDYFGEEAEDVLQAIKAGRVEFE